MRLNLAILFCAFLVTGLLTLWWQDTPPEIQSVPVAVSEDIAGAPPAPAFSFITTDKETFALEDFKGKTVILNFWASWCAPCLAEFPKLLETAARYQDRVVLIAMTGERTNTGIEKFFQSLDKKSQQRLQQENVLIALDPGMKITQGLYQTFRLPETVIIGPDQTLRKKLVGANWTIDEIAQAIEK